MAKVLEWKASFERSGRFPLDIDSVFSTTGTTVAYASENERAYVGQIVVVTGETDSGVYRLAQVGEDAKVVKLYDADNIKEVLGKAEGTIKDVIVNKSSVVNEEGIADIDLTNYATKQDLSHYINGEVLTGYVTNDRLETTLKDYATKGNLDEYIPNSNLLNEVQGSEDDLDKKVVSAKFVNDKLTAISSAISNFSLFEVVTELPTNEEDINKNKIYLVHDIPELIGNTGNTFTEYIYVTDNGDNYWEVIGYYTANTDINLNDYVRKSDYYQLEDRVKALEALVTGSSDAKLITTENIKNYAVVEVVSDGDIEATKNSEGALTIKLNKITNESYDITNL